jgi:hypothetical protein
MTNEERKTALLDLWHDIAMDRDLQVHLRLKASEHEARALGLIGNDPGITILNEPDQTEKELKKLTIRQLEAIALASDETLGKTTAPEGAETQSKRKDDQTIVDGSSTPENARKTPNTANGQTEAQK